MWREALDLSEEVYRVTGRGEFDRDFGLRGQIRRAAVSVMSNVAEGYERNGNREFRQYLYVAKASCGEVRAQLHQARRLDYVDQETFLALYRRSMTTTRMLAALIRALTDPDARETKRQRSESKTREPQRGS